MFMSCNVDVYALADIFKTFLAKWKLIFDFHVPGLVVMGSLCVN